MNRRARRILLFLTLCGLTHGAEPVLVGRGVEIRDVMLPGPELRVRKSRGLAEPLALRITATYPHGTAGFRYDFHCVPMIAGAHDLTQFLETASGEPAKGLPPILVEAIGVLPAGPPGGLKEPPVAVVPRVGGYESMIPYGVGLWGAAGIGVFWYFRKRKARAQFASLVPAPTLGEQLKALLQRAIAEPLGTAEQAELERLLLAHGREQLGLAHASDPAVYRALRENPNTASWLRTLEAWLHRPSTSPPSSEELRELLARIP
jgi:hypothetical protein